MSILSTGEAHIEARARLMLLLGEQLITDEVAAVSELVKNAYDANAPKVTLTLFHVSEPDGYIRIKDNGHGMTLPKVLSSWLELGTLSKARGKDMSPRLSEEGKRICLGEKGLGRLAIHKLGYMTELVTKRADASTEIRVVLDWTAFERNEGFLQEVPVKWEETEPRVFMDPDWSYGTCITISSLRRIWTKDIVENVERGINALKSPFADLSDFEIDIQIKDKLAPEIPPFDLVKQVEKATYIFTGEIDAGGIFEGSYSFTRPDLDMQRKKTIKKDIRKGDLFSNERKPTCGPFKIRFYSWDLGMRDQKAVFGDTATYREVIKPNAGVKVFRDGFRVLPYGNYDNDWLNMDLERVRRFEDHLSRNQVIAAIEISSQKNPLLLDKTDREGLIDNEALKDFRSLLKSVITEFEAERLVDRQKLKAATGRLHDDNYYRTTFSRNLAALSTIVTKQVKTDGEIRLQAQKLISDTKEIFDRMLRKNEQPLLVAASIGLTFMMPTHEVQRDLHEALKVLRNMRDTGEAAPEQIESVVSLVKQGHSIVSGIGRLMQQTDEEESFDPGKTASFALQLMHYKFERNKIKTDIVAPTGMKVKGSNRLIAVVLLNFLDNSFYWLQRNKEEDRKIKVIVTCDDKECILIVSDNGPGFEDNVDTVTMPFFTRKPNGMGLGLYIADRIAKINGGKLKILEPDSVPGLLSGASIAMVLKKDAR